MIYALLVIASILFAILAFRTQRLIASALWLAGVSALVSILCYLLGAYTVAVIELSVGAGLVTVLFVFAISIAGEEGNVTRSVIPYALAGGVVIVALALLGWLTLPITVVFPPVSQVPLPDMIWNLRSMDIFVQIVLVFAGVLGLLGLLAEAKAPLKHAVADEYARKRDRELEVLHEQSLEKETI